MTEEIIKEQEKRSFEEDDSPELPPPDIVAYNELRSCADLYRMYSEGILNIHPEFQREIVWKGPAQTRFIDSLVKQLPIPSMCFSFDYKTQKWQVIDGLQRMASIIRFLEGDPTWVLSKLKDIDPELSGAQAKSFLDKELPLNQYLQRVQNLTLPITVLRCDYSKKSHTFYLFTIFHRLNTGAVKLNNQEIRNCIYSGKLNDLLKELNSQPSWMKLNRMKDDTGYRFLKQELILRLFALNDRYETYGGRLAKFLNDYMAENKNPSDEQLNSMTELFTQTVSLVFESIYNSKGPLIKKPISIIEATLVGVARNIDFISTLPADAVRDRYERMLENVEFSDERLSEGLSGKPRLIGRMNAAVAAFSGQ
ncbi:MAG: DUF262 domain-containing protein [Anaerolineales bacterium]|nr:DUF262 domain-containing protein [Anaerolineales bacterium]